MRPAREPFRSSGQTYFVSSQTFDRQPFFRHERWAVLMQEILQHYRGNSYQLHAYVIMPDHFHAILSPQDSIERAMQNIKGGFSFRAGQAFHWKHNIWQAGFSDHRIRDAEDWDRYVDYIRRNPVKSRLCSSSDDYRYLAVNLDPIPQRQKPLTLTKSNGGAEAPPLQNPVWPELAQSQSKAPEKAPTEAAPFVSAKPGVEGDGLQPVRHSIKLSGFSR